MKIRQTVSIAIAFSIATGGFAFAQGESDQQGQQRGQRQVQRSSQRSDQQGQRDNRQPQRRADQNRYANNQQRGDERGAGPDHQWHRGDRLPAEYRHNNYVVDD
jgi:Ni/Co efflux regulator RcnB